MDKNLLEKIDPLIDDVADQLTQLMDGPALETVREKLADLSRELAPYSVTLEWNRGHLMRFASTAYRCSSAHRKPMCDERMPAPAGVRDWC